MRVLNQTLLAFSAAPKPRHTGVVTPETCPQLQALEETDSRPYCPRHLEVTDLHTHTHKRAHTDTHTHTPSPERLAAVNSAAPPVHYNYSFAFLVPLCRSLYQVRRNTMLKDTLVNT